MDPISTAIAAIGAGLSFFGAGQGREDQRRASELEQQKNNIRQEQIKLDALTQTRDVIRASQLRAATGINAAANSGVGLDSSSVQGGLGQVQSAQNLRTGLIDQSLNFGSQIFDINSELTSLQGRQSDNQFITSIGSSLMSNSRTLGGFFGEGGQSQRR